MKKILAVMIILATPALAGDIVENCYNCKVYTQKKVVKKYTQPRVVVQEVPVIIQQPPVYYGLPPIYYPVYPACWFQPGPWGPIQVCQ